MDLSENGQYEWSDWFTKARPARTEQQSPSPDGPRRPRPAFGREQTLAGAILDGFVPGSMLTASQAAPPAEDAPTPLEAGPVEASSPTEATPVEPSPVEASPVGAGPVEASSPTEPTPVEASPVGAGPVEATPVEPSPVEASPVEASPVGAGPVEASSPTEPTPVEASPVGAGPVEATPVEPSPVEASPVEAGPVEASSVGAGRVQADAEADSELAEPGTVQDETIPASTLAEAEGEPIPAGPPPAAEGEAFPAGVTGTDDGPVPSDGVTGTEPVPAATAAQDQPAGAPPDDGVRPRLRAPDAPTTSMPIMTPGQLLPRRPRPQTMPPSAPPVPEPFVAPPGGHRPAGALPWILPTGGRAGYQPADAPAAPGPAEAPRADPVAGPAGPPEPASANAPDMRPVASVLTEDHPVTPDGYAAPPGGAPPAGPAAQAPPIEQAPPAAQAPPTEQAPPAAQAPPTRRRKGKTARKRTWGQAGVAAAYKEPEVVSGADTVMLPKLKPRQATASAPQTTTTKKTAASAAGTIGTSSPAEVDNQLTTMMPTQTMPLSVADPARPEQPYNPGQRRKWISRAVLLAILLMQAVLSLRLHNTAFEDEAQYLYAGRLEILYLFHHVPLPLDYASYFSGAPVLYPVLAAAANDVGGLAAARAVSLVEMLATTGLLYMISRRLFNERVAICAALLFSVTESVTFLGHFATYDASCLFLLALAAWIMVRTAVSRWPLFLLAAPVAALAVATKYAGLLFVPTVAVLPVLTAWPYPHRRRVWAYPVIFGVAVGALLYGALKWGGHSYVSALQTTTTSRATGDTPIRHIGWEFLKWGGVQFGVAVLGTIAYAWRARTDRDEEIAPAGSRLRRILLGLVLTGTALLAPAYQAHIHTDVSFLKHIGFGLFFAAPMAGVGLTRILGDYFRRPLLAIGVWGLAVLLGMSQAATLFGAWGNSTAFVNAFSRYLKPGANYLVEVPEVPIYYLEGGKDAQAKQFSSTFTITYQNPQGAVLGGVTGYEAAVKNDFFQVIAYDGLTTPGTDNAIASELAKNPDYRRVAVVKEDTAYHTGAYSIWVRKSAPKTNPGKLIG